MKKVLLTAFEPFDGETLNPSLEVVREIAKKAIDYAEVRTLELPVDRFRAIDIALAQLDTEQPDVVIMLGEGGRRFRVTPERVAINIDDFRIADNIGNQPIGEPIIDGAPVGYFSTLPVYDIVKRLRVASIPAAISNSAGTYLCNRLFYCVMHHLSVQDRKIPAGFIHLPYLHEQILEKLVDFPSLSKDTLVEAANLAIAVSLAL